MIENKFETIVGVNGDSISGGQKQIILLLRNYFKKNKICILDEPTAALDNETRKIVVDIIKEISSNATLIIITHDLQNLEYFGNYIDVLKDLMNYDCLKVYFPDHPDHRKVDKNINEFFKDYI